MPSATAVRRAVAVVGGCLVGGGVDNYLTDSGSSGLLLAGLGLGLIAAMLVRD